MKKFVMFAMVVCVCAPALALAEMFVCEDTSKPVVERRLQWFFRDPSVIRPDFCRMVPDAEVMNNIDLIAVVSRLDYLKMSIIDTIFGVAIEKTQGEKDAIDAAIAAAAAARAAILAERTSDNLCAEVTLDGINNKIQNVADLIHTDLDTATTLGQLRAATRDSFDKVLLLVRRNYRCDLATRR